MKNQGKIREIRPISNDIWEITFELDKTEGFSFSPGQFVEIVLPELVGDPRGHRREFSIFSTPDELPDLRIAIRHTGSVFKKTLLNSKENLAVEINGPYGDFILPSESKELIYLIGGGMGITPFLSMLRYKPNLNLKLIWSNKEKIKPWLNELDDLKQNLLTLDFFWQSERFDINQIKSHVDFSKAKFYIAGPIGLVIDIKNSLIEADISSQSIFTDEFTGY